MGLPGISHGLWKAQHSAEDRPVFLAQLLASSHCSQHKPQAHVMLSPRLPGWLFSVSCVRVAVSFGRAGPWTVPRADPLGVVCPLSEQGDSWLGTFRLPTHMQHRATSP